MYMTFVCTGLPQKKGPAMNKLTVLTQISPLATVSTQAAYRMGGSFLTLLPIKQLCEKFSLTKESISTAESQIKAGRSAHIHST